MIVYLQTLTNHKNASLASSTRGAYIALMNLIIKSDSISDDVAREILNKTIPFIAGNSASETQSFKLISFRLKALCIIMPVSWYLSSFHS